jgi:acetyl-CoA C-acetyltransferase
MAAALQGLVTKLDLRGQTMGDVALGAVIKHSRDWNLARESVIDSGLTLRTPGVDLQRACGTSIEATILIANKIALGQIDCGIAGGTDTVSDAPIVFRDEFRHILLDVHAARSAVQRIMPWFRLRPRHFAPQFPGVVEPRTGLSMGESMEITAKEWDVQREHQDQLALASHVKAAAAYDAGWYEDLVVPTMTAGNSTPLTDGAAAVLLANEDWARKKNLPILAYLTFAKVSAVDFIHDEGLLMAPAYAVSDMLRQADLRLQDFDFYEIHEAFAAQVIATLKAWQSEKFCREKLGRNEAMGPIDLSKLNVKGGSVAIGHPFGATGARVIATMAKLLSENGSGRGLISVCAAGGMGVTAIMEAA